MSPARARKSSKRARPTLSAFAKILAGRTLISGRIESVEIGIDENGQIVRVAKSLRGAPRHDLGEMILLPAANDLHVHMREPGPPDAGETIAGATTQAALGGVGLVGEMPNTRPATDSSEGAQSKAARVRGKAEVDVLLYGLARRPDQIRSIAADVGAYKLYLSDTTEVGSAPEGRELGEVLFAVASTGLALSVHAEDPARFRHFGPVGDPIDWDAHRPVPSEESAVSQLLPPPPNLRLHVAHVTSTTIADRLLEAGHCFEATPHHLLLEARRGVDARWKVNPPLRPPATRELLWEAFRTGRIPCLASDHAPHPVTMKRRSFSLAPSGVPGVETMLPLLLAKVRGRELDLSVLVAAACDRPARWLGLPQGRIFPAHRANLIAVDFRRRSKVQEKKLHAMCGWTPFEGFPAIFPVEHYRDGERIVEEGEFVGRHAGRVVRPQYAPATSELGPTVIPRPTLEDRSPQES